MHHAEPISLTDPKCTFLLQTFGHEADGINTAFQGMMEVERITPKCYVNGVCFNLYIDRVCVWQELITNTSLAELEKQLKEKPFKAPRVGQWVTLPCKDPGFMMRLGRRFRV